MGTFFCLILLDGGSSTSDDSAAGGVVVSMYSARVVIVGTVEEIILSAAGAYVERGVIFGTVGAIILAASGSYVEIVVIVGTYAAREVVVGMIGSISGSGGSSGMYSSTIVSDGVVRYSVGVVVGLYDIGGVVSSLVKGPGLTYFE